MSEILSNGKANDNVKVLNQNQSAFGAVDVSELSAFVTASFPYNVNSVLYRHRANQSGTITQADNMAVLQSGAAANSSAELLSRGVVEYRPGQGGIWRGTGLFTTGVANSKQLLGLGEESDGFFFGYDGASFGVCRRKGGQHEVRTLTVSTKSSTAENITITLNGNATSTVAVTNGADATVTANEIAAHDYSSVGRGWDAWAVGDTVIFVSYSDSPRSGSYSLSGATTAVGSFAQTVAGVTHTDTWVAEADWNGEPLPFTLDPTKGNVYEIRYQWLGFGSVHFCLENPETGQLFNVHTIEYSNANTSPSVNNPNLPLYAGVVNDSNTSNLTVKVGSMMGGTEGKISETGLKHGMRGSLTTVSATEKPVLSIRNKLVYGGINNRTRCRVVLTSAAAEHTKPIEVNVYANAVLEGAAFTDFDSGDGFSCMQEDTAATGISGGLYLFTIELGKSGQQIIEVPAFTDGVMEPGDIMTFAAEASSGSGGEVAVAVYVVEML